MKKKILALTLALTMVLGTGSVVGATEGGHTEGTTAQAGVSSESTYSNSSNGVTGELNTEFYMSIDKYAISKLPAKYDEEKTIEGKITDNASRIIKYIVKYDVIEDGTISVTVPLYVCMYAYGGDGTVIVPEGTAYQMKNSSTKKVTTSITEIYPYYEVTVIDANSINDITISSGDYNVTSGRYGFYQEMDTDGNSGKYIAVNLDQCAYNSNDNVYYYKGTKLAVSATIYDTAYGSVDNEVTNTDMYKVGEPYPKATSDENKTVGKKLRVSSVKATTASTWTLVKGSETSLSAKEFKMSINSVDLATATTEAISTTRDSDLWIIDVPTLDNDSNQVTVPGKLNLPITASIAGNAVNETGDVNVVSVSYTIASAD
jgi:hypothetical protein